MAELLTIRDAADRCGIAREALRRRVDRGTVRAVKGHDGVRRIPRSELERAGLWPGSEATTGTEVELRAELAAVTQRLEHAEHRADVEAKARERAELAQHEARAEAIAAAARAEQAQAQAAEVREQVAKATATADELEAKLVELTTAGPIKAWKLRRQLRSEAVSPT